MRYEEILKEQKKYLNDDIKWWPDFFYHFTDVHNVVEILSSGWIMSREQAVSSGMMKKDNASRAVIEATRSESKRYGRLYFRPLTPTQYHNEGYKPETVRNMSLNANCPIPVFLCLDSATLLSYPGTQFAEKGVSGNRYNIQQGEENFALLDFRKIYHEGPYGESERDIKDYRHSEVIRESGFPVEPFLRCILCRTIAEKETLLYMIRSNSIRMYNSYKDRILYRPKIKCFYYNGIFIKNILAVDNTLRIEFNDPEQRYRHNESNIYFRSSIDLIYKKENGSIVCVDSGRVELNYGNVRSATMKLRSDVEYDFLRVQIKFDEEIMYENELDMRWSELF